MISISHTNTRSIFLHNLGEGQGELLLFFDRDDREEVRYHFEEYIAAHLQRQALPESMRRRRIFVCSRCNTPVSDLQATRRREYGFTSIKCNVCEAAISLLDRQERLTTEPPRVCEARVSCHSCDSCRWRADPRASLLSRGHDMGRFSPAAAGPAGTLDVGHYWKAQPSHIILQPVEKPFNG